jgi:hypothetical protein
VLPFGSTQFQQITEYQRFERQGLWDIPSETEDIGKNMKHFHYICCSYIKEYGKG